MSRLGFVLWGTGAVMAGLAAITTFVSHATVWGFIPLQMPFPIPTMIYIFASTAQFYECNKSRKVTLSLGKETRE